MLRRRMVWCCGILLGLLGISVLGTWFEYQEVVEGKPTPLEWVVLGMLDDVALGALLVATLMYVLAGVPDRRRLVGAITISSVAIMCVATVFEIMRGQVHQTDVWGDRLVTPMDPGLLAARWALYVCTLLVTVPLMVIPMRVGESVRIAGACWVVYMALIVFQGGASAAVACEYGAMAIAAVIPGMWFSALRYRRFDAAFRHRDLQGKFGELAKELGQARRLHEALLPAPIESGPVRVKFVYEPMREIGGDFVFVERGPGDGAVCVVLIDVSGHGVAAALAVNRLHGELVRMFGAEGKSITSARVIENLNAYVYLTLAGQGVFATAVCVCVKAGGNGEWEMEWSNAGHPPAMMRSRAGAVHRLDPTATMLGVLEPEGYSGAARRMAMMPGDVVVAYTDGLIEARGEGGEEYGVGRVEAVVRGGEGAAETLARAVAGHRRGRVMDDLLVVEVGVVGSATIVSGRAEMRLAEG